MGPRGVKRQGRSRSRSRSRSVRRTARRASPPPTVKFIATKDREYSMLWLNADEVSPHILQQAKNTAIGLLQMSGSFDEAFAKFDYDLDGGWPDIDPEDNFVTYVQMVPGLSSDSKLDRIHAVAVGSNQTKRARGAALALVVAAAVDQPTVVTPEMLHEHHELSLMVAAAKQSLHELRREAGGGGAEVRGGRASGSGEVTLEQKVDDLCRENLELRMENEKLRRTLDKVVQIATQST